MDVKKINRWRSYAFFRGADEIKELCSGYFSTRHSHLLFVLGCGFDPRMNNVFYQLLESRCFEKISCILIDYPAETESEETVMYKKNFNQFKMLCENYGIERIDVKDEHAHDVERRIMFIIQHLRTRDYAIYDDIIIDVSAMPKAIYFNVCRFFYKKCEEEKKNLLFSVSENVKIDSLIDDIAGDEIYPIHGFGKHYLMESNLDKRSVLIPLLGERHVNELLKIYENFRPVDVCPILPFPSQNPRRSEDLLISHMQLFKRLDIDEPQNFTYADERNPFELYGILCDLINNYRKTLSPITDCVCFGIATLTSKLMSLGALLVGLEQADDISYYSSSPVSYSVKDQDELWRINNESESFIMWITGEAYE